MWACHVGSPYGPPMWRRYVAFLRTHCSSRARSSGSTHPEHHHTPRASSGTVCSRLHRRHRHRRHPAGYAGVVGARGTHAHDDESRKGAAGACIDRLWSLASRDRLAHLEPLLYSSESGLYGGRVVQLHSSSCRCRTCELLARPHHNLGTECGTGHSALRF